MVDSAAATESDRLDDALVELEANGVSYGEGFAHGGAPRRPRADPSGGRRHPAPLRGARRQGRTRGLRPAPGVVRAASGAGSRPAGAEGVRVGGYGRLLRAAFRTAGRQPQEPTPRPGAAGSGADPRRRPRATGGASTHGSRRRGTRCAARRGTASAPPPFRPDPSARSTAKTRSTSRVPSTASSARRRRRGAGTIRMPSSKASAPCSSSSGFDGSRACRP